MVLPMVYQTAAVQISLLTQMDIRRSADESRFVSVGIERQWGTRAPRGLVIPRPIPGGYQNQGIPDRIQEIIDRVTDRLEGGIPGGWRPGFGCGVPIIGCGLPIVGCGGFPGIGCGLPGVGPGLPDAGGCGSVIGPCDSGSLIP